MQSSTVSPAPTAPLALAVVDDDSFDAAFTAPGVALVDFTASWCAPCHAMLPILLRLAAEHAGRVRVVTLDVEVARLTAQRFRVTSMPTLMLVRDGREVGRIVGARKYEVLAGAIARALRGDVAITGP